MNFADILEYSVNEKGLTLFMNNGKTNFISNKKEEYDELWFSLVSKHIHRKKDEKRKRYFLLLFYLVLLINLIGIAFGFMYKLNEEERFITSDQLEELSIEVSGIYNTNNSYLIQTTTNNKIIFNIEESFLSTLEKNNFSEVKVGDVLLFAIDEYSANTILSLNESSVFLYIKPFAVKSDGKVYLSLSEYNSISKNEESVFYILLIFIEVCSFLLLFVFWRFKNKQWQDVERYYISIENVLGDEKVTVTEKKNLLKEIREA